jgi:hypothetical protein
MKQSCLALFIVLLISLHNAESAEKDYTDFVKYMKQKIT